MRRRLSNCCLNGVQPKVIFPFCGHKNANDHTDLLDTSFLEAEPDSSVGERPRAHRGAFIRARCATKRSRAIFCTERSKDGDRVVSKSSCMCEWRRSLEWLEPVPHSKLECHNNCVWSCSTSKLRTPFSQLVRAHRTGVPQRRRQKHRKQRNGDVRVWHLPRQP